MEKIGIQPTACKDDPPAYQGLIKSLLMSSTPVISITFSANELWSVSWPIQALWDDLKNIPVFITLCCHRLMIAFFHRMAYWCTIPFGFWAAHSPGFFWSEETQAWGPLFGKTVQVMSSDGSNLLVNLITIWMHSVVQRRELFAGMAIQSGFLHNVLWWLESVGNP